jgi:tRNA A37 threonylcarbamoyladenosine synthetase subunit TsaC/SUA5/YrdC
MKNINEMTVVEAEIEFHEEAAKLARDAKAWRAVKLVAKWGLIAVGTATIYGMLTSGNTNENKVES